MGEGKDVADVCRTLQITEATNYRWRNQFGGLKADDAKRLKDLGRENSTLKRLLAESELEKAALKEDREGKLLDPEGRWAAVAHLARVLEVSEWFACRVTGNTEALSTVLRPRRRPPILMRPCGIGRETGHDNIRDKGSAANHGAVIAGPAICVVCARLLPEPVKRTATGAAIMCAESAKRCRIL